MGFLSRRHKEANADRKFLKKKNLEEDAPKPTGRKWTGLRKKKDPKGAAKSTEKRTRRRTSKKSTKEDEPDEVDEQEVNLSNATAENTFVEDDEEDVSVVPKAELADMPRLIEDLSRRSAPRALRQMFDLSDDNPQRVSMVTQNPQFIPTLLKFLKSCPLQSSEQYLTLLVLNNVSIPSPNKRLIAIEHGGAGLLADILSQDLSCHLIAIILVNLTFSDSELRRDLAPMLLPPITYCLQESCRVDDADAGIDDYGGSFMAFPETAKWCCTAVKNLTRPTTSLADSHAGKQAVELGVVPVLHKTITFTSPEKKISNTTLGIEACRTRSSIQSAPPSGPWQWETNSLADAALFCVMNLAVSCKEDSMTFVPQLEKIANFDGNFQGNLLSDDSTVLDFQRLKARMALSYLVGFSTSNDNITMDASKRKSMLQLSLAEARLLVDLLDHTMAKRSSPLGLYSAATFPVKWVLFAIRNFLPLNGSLLNQQQALVSRLLLILIEFVSEKSSAIDTLAAEYAVVSLYYLSTHGLEGSFYIDRTSTELAQILCAYMEKGTEFGIYASRQILLRLNHLQIVPVKTSSQVQLNLPKGSLCYKPGAQPQSNILHRPVEAYNMKTKEKHLFNSALDAVQSLLKKGFDNDEILQANKIANAAKSQSEEFQFVWTWLESSDQIFESGLSRRREDGPLSIFGFSCGPVFCAGEKI